MSPVHRSHTSLSAAHANFELLVSNEILGNFSDMRHRVRLWVEMPNRQGWRIKPVGGLQPLGRGAWGPISTPNILRNETLY